MVIDRCVCTQQYFSSLKEIAHSENLTLIELAERTRCGKNCGFCIAYLKRMYETGETVFFEILPHEKF